MRLSVFVFMLAAALVAFALEAYGATPPQGRGFEVVAAAALPVQVARESPRQGVPSLAR